MLAMENGEPAENREPLEGMLRRITEQLERLTNQGERVTGDITTLQMNMNEMGHRQLEQYVRLREIREGIAGAGQPTDGGNARGNSPAQPNGAVAGPRNEGNEAPQPRGPIGGGGPGEANPLEEI